MKIKELIQILSKHDESLDVVSTGIDSSGYSHHDGPPNAIFEHDGKLYLTHVAREEGGDYDCYSKTKYIKDITGQAERDK
jgi:hypothetical protein